MVKLKKKSLSRGSFRTHGRVIRNKNFFIFGLGNINFLFMISNKIVSEISKITVQQTNLQSFFISGYRLGAGLFT